MRLKIIHPSGIKAAVFANILFAILNLITLIPEWVYPGDPQTDAEWEAKINFIYAMWTVKAFIPYILIFFAWGSRKWSPDVFDYGYVGLFLFTCAIDTIQAVFYPTKDTDNDWLWFGIVWGIITIGKIWSIIKIVK